MPSTAVELMAEMERLLREDPEYRAASDAREAERLRAVQQRLADAQPVLDDLAQFNYSPQNWGMLDEPPATAITTLLKHLEMEHPEHVLAWVARILGRSKSAELWDDLVRRYTVEHQPGVDIMSCAYPV